MHRRLTAALLLSGIALVASATPAFAHAELVASTPAGNASLATAPARIELTFNEPVTLPENPLEVVGPGNVTWQVGTPRVAGAEVSAPVTASGPAGRYTVVYHVVSDDGDTVSGSVAFTMTTGATAEAAAPAPASAQPPSTGPSRTSPVASDSGTLLWVWLAAGAILLAAVVFVTLRVRRSGR
jgi:methionine-rich copper-binding protein CopC